MKPGRLAETSEFESTVDGSTIPGVVPRPKITLAPAKNGPPDIRIVPPSPMSSGSGTRLVSPGAVASGGSPGTAIINAKPSCAFSSGAITKKPAVKKSAAGTVTCAWVVVLPLVVILFQLPFVSNT